MRKRQSEWKVTVDGSHLETLEYLYQNGEKSWRELEEEEDGLPEEYPPVGDLNFLGLVEKTYVRDGVNKKVAHYRIDSNVEGLIDEAVGKDKTYSKK